MNDTQQATEVWTVPGWSEELRCESNRCRKVHGRGDHSADYLWAVGCGCQLFVCESRKNENGWSQFVVCQKCGDDWSLLGTFRPI